MAQAKVQTSTSGRRFVAIDEVIKRRLEQIKKNRNGNSNGRPKGVTVAGESKTSIQGKGKNPAT